MAVKISPTSVVRSACKEVIALTRVNHPHIVQLLGVQVDMHEERVFMVMELCQGGELFDRIAECGGLAEDEARRYFVQTLHALAHCHENRVYHRDLKPENILLDADDNVKVADFGLAAVYRHVAGDSGGYLQHTKVGSVMYAAPEVLTSTAAMGYDAARADMWSLGVILFSMLSGTLPFTCAAASKCKRYAAVLTHGVGVMCPEHLSPQVTQLLGQLLHPDPAQRITPAEALRTEWLCGGQPTWPKEYLGRSRPAADTESRSWTITMRAPQEQMRQLVSSSAAPSRASASAGAASSCGGSEGAACARCAGHSEAGAVSSCGGSSSSSSSRSEQNTRSGGDADAKRMRVTESEVAAAGIGDSSALPAASSSSSSSSRGASAARAGIAEGATRAADEGVTAEGVTAEGVTAEGVTAEGVTAASDRSGGSGSGSSGGSGGSGSSSGGSSGSSSGSSSGGSSGGSSGVTAGAGAPSVVPSVGRCGEAGPEASGVVPSALEARLREAMPPPPPRDKSLPSAPGAVVGAPGFPAPVAPLEGALQGLPNLDAARGALQSLPLRGCVSEYVQRFGWGSLPSGTEHLLRDILQTLRSMGLRFKLEEHNDAMDPASDDPRLGQPLEASEITSEKRTQPLEASEIAEMRTQRLSLTILF